MTTRRRLIALSAAAAASAALPVRAARATEMRVLATPGCGCCHAWAALAAERGFDVTVEDMEEPGREKAALGIPADLASCHTVRAGGYLFEGHVPLDAVEAVLRDRPAIMGLAVPGMPMGSPGMGDDPAARFDVFAFDADGARRVFYRAGTPAPFVEG